MNSDDMIAAFELYKSAPSDHATRTAILSRQARELRLSEDFVTAIQYDEKLAARSSDPEAFAFWHAALVIVACTKQSLSSPVVPMRDDG